MTERFWAQHLFLCSWEVRTNNWPWEMTVNEVVLAPSWNLWLLPYLRLKWGHLLLFQMMPPTNFRHTLTYSQMVPKADASDQLIEIQHKSGPRQLIVQWGPENATLTMSSLLILSRKAPGGLAGSGAAFASCSLPWVQLLPPPSAFCPHERVGAGLLWQYGSPLHHTFYLTIAHRKVCAPSLTREDKHWCYQTGKEGI